MKMTVDRDLVTPQPFRVWLSGASAFLSVWMHAGCRLAPPGARVSPEVSPCGVGAALLQGPDQEAAFPRWPVHPQACAVLHPSLLGNQSGFHILLTSNSVFFID